MQVGYPKEFTILRDMATGQSRGCAFAIYDDKAIAEAAIEKLDKKITLPGGAMPLEVHHFSPETFNCLCVPLQKCWN